MYVAGRRLRVGVRDPVAGKYVARRRGGLACAGTVAGGVRVGVHGVPRRVALGVDRACGDGDVATDRMIAVRQEAPWNSKGCA